MIAILEGGERDGQLVEVEEGVYEINFPKYTKPEVQIGCNSVVKITKCLPIIKYKKVFSLDDTHSVFRYYGDNIAGIVSKGLNLIQPS